MKPLGFLEPILQRQHLKKTLKISDHSCVSEAIQIIWQNKVLAEVKFTDRKLALQQKPQKVQNGLMPFVTQYNPSVPNLKNILMSKWHLIENQPLLREIYREPPLISYRRGKSLKDILVQAKLQRSKTYYITKQRESCLACQSPLTTRFKEKIPSNLANSTQRSRVTQFIANKKSRQEFDPLIGTLCDKEVVEPLHLKNNGVQHLHSMLLEKAIRVSNIPEKINS